MNKWLKENFFYILLLLSIYLYTYWEIRGVFYQQDEWRALGVFFSYNSFGDLFKDLNIFQASMGEGRIFSSIVGYLLFRSFPFEGWPLAIYSLSFHFLNGLLVFQLGSRLTNSKHYSLISSIFFLFCAVSSSTVSWYSTSVGTLPATTLILLSVLFFLKSIPGKQRFLILSFVLLFISQPFKEIGYFLFLILPFTSLLFQKPDFKLFVKSYWYYLITFIVITVYRIFQLQSYSLESAVFSQVSGNNFLLTIFLRVILYPLTSSSLIFIPSEFLIKIAKLFTNHYYPFFPSVHYNLIVESVILDLLAVILTFLIILLISFIWRRATIKTQKNMLITIILLISTFLPYVILSKSYAYLDSRYYYLGAGFSGILLSFLVRNTAAIFKSNVIKFGLFIFIGLYLFWQLQITRVELIKLVQISAERKKILYSLTQNQTGAEGKNIFYISGDRNYYLSSGNNVPFQQGVGYTILVWLKRDNADYKQFLKEGLLWDLGSQGYFESKNSTFGYFWDKDLLLKTLKNKNLTVNQVNAFFYDSKFEKLKRINLEEIW